MSIAMSARWIESFSFPNPLTFVIDCDAGCLVRSRLDLDASGLARSRLEAEADRLGERAAGFGKGAVLLGCRPDERSTLASD